ncbi:MAG TPA: D-aminoacylase [Chryseosolibacter sp.]|nr:D-aminoacylase [Chryseosolibacter sp.]
MRFLIGFSLALVALSLLLPQQRPDEYDCIIRNGMIYDGAGGEPFKGDIAIHGDTIIAIGNLKAFRSKKELDATGLAVAPGFINMLSWAGEHLAADGEAMSDIKQGVTLEVFGEGFSPGPVRRKNRAEEDSLWTTLGGYFGYLERKGISPNVASFVGATSVRIHEMGFSARSPSEQELSRMKALVQEAMEEGAMGLGSSLIYAPATYASTEELIELAKVASGYGGMYITHMRSEGDFILPAIDETIRISKEANIPAEIYHLKVNLSRNWSKIDTVLAKIDSARNAGVPLTANMYPYNASGTGLNSRLPTWVQEGGAAIMRKRISIPAIRKRVLYEMEKGIPSKNSEPESVTLMRFRLAELNSKFRGKTLKEAAEIYGKSADETALDLIVRDRSRIEALYFQQSEEVVRRIMQLPYVSYGSDAGSYNIEKDKRNLADHPRAFGTFARILGKYVRDEKILPLAEAIRKMTSLPAANLKLEKRGLLKKGNFADVVVFHPDSIADRATYENPHQYAVGMIHVFVNGVAVLENGEHTMAKPGRIIRGAGYIPK